MQVSKTGVRSVDDLYGVDITGNIIPHSWYSTIQTKAGKPDLTAITILSEILYWHRPREECGESDDGGIKLHKRFKADLLQLSYKQLWNKFRLTKDQSRRGIERLEELGLIKRHFRTVVTENCILNNVMYIELFTDKLLKVTYPDGAGDPSRKKPTRVLDKTDEVIGNSKAGSGEKSMTNTKNTTEITNKDYYSVYLEEVERVKEQIDYESVIRDTKASREMIDEMVNIIVEINLYAEDPQWIDGSLIPVQVVREKLRSVTGDVMKEIIKNLRSTARDVVNTRGYILTTLFNAVSTYQLGLDLEVTRDMYRKEAGVWGA